MRTSRAAPSPPDELVQTDHAAGSSTHRAEDLPVLRARAGGPLGEVWKPVVFARRHRRIGRCAPRRAAAETEAIFVLQDLDDLPVQVGLVVPGDDLDPPIAAAAEDASQRFFGPEEVAASIAKSDASATSSGAFVAALGDLTTARAQLRDAAAGAGRSRSRATRSTNGRPAPIGGS